MKMKPQLDKSLEENARALVPLLFDDLFTRLSAFGKGPVRADDLHEIRLSGKKLRYVMETVQKAFGDEFQARLAQIKELVTLMGSIHDCDIHLPRLVGHLEVLRAFNRLAKPTAARMPLGGVRHLLREQEREREELCRELFAMIGQWKKSRSRERLFASLSPKGTP